MDPTSLLLSLLFGSIGVGYVMYARKMGEWKPAAAGFGLLVVPYLISGVVALVVACVLLMALPFLFRE
jgi:phosphate/sulfate permease